jgi:hypothetical protein
MQRGDSEKLRGKSDRASHHNRLPTDYDDYYDDDQFYEDVSDCYPYCYVPLYYNYVLILSVCYCHNKIRTLRQTSCLTQ